jgi:hypothetical protein
MVWPVRTDDGGHPVDEVLIDRPTIEIPYSELGTHNALPVTETERL